MRIVELAIFILATTRWFQKESSWDARVLPIFNTFGRSTEHLYFVFGSNKFDHDFLNKNCIAVEENGVKIGSAGDGVVGGGGGSSLVSPSFSSNSHGGGGSSSSSSSSSSSNKNNEPPPSMLHRNLVASYKQTKLENKTIIYRCSENVRATTPDKLPPAQVLPSSAHLNALWTANCTGEYFGIGPTCRCQESLRYLLYSPKFKDVNWFVFMDDDVYIRPFSLMAMLNQFQFKANPEVALVSSNVYRGFGFSKYWVEKNVDCKVEGVHSYAIAMPGIINRKALELIAPAIDANGMTDLHSIWGGSHDAILGLIFWLYRIDTYSVANIYVDRKSLSVDIIDRVDKNSSIFIHRVKNFTHFPKVVTQAAKQGPSAYHFYNYFKDWAEEDAPEEYQQRGARGYSSLIKLVDSGVHKTVFAQKALEMRSAKKYFNYHYTDCMLL